MAKRARLSQIPGFFYKNRSITAIPRPAGWLDKVMTDEHIQKAQLKEIEDPDANKEEQSPANPISQPIHTIVDQFARDNRAPNVSEMKAITHTHHLRRELLQQVEHREQ